MDKLAAAFGVKGAVEGEAFNRELQEQRKQERIAEREQREKDKIKVGWDYREYAVFERTAFLAPQCICFEVPFVQQTSRIF